MRIPPAQFWGWPSRTKNCGKYIRQLRLSRHGSQQTTTLVPWRIARWPLYSNNSKAKLCEIFCLPFLLFGFSVFPITVEGCFLKHSSDEAALLEAMP